MDGEAGLRMREKGSSLESKVRRKCLIRTLTRQIILHAEFASVCAATLARREEEEKGGRERRGAVKKDKNTGDTLSVLRLAGTQRP